MAPAIPYRWLDYKPVGEIIKGTRFIAFKVPLREHIVKSVASDIRLNCNSLLDKIPDLGMIIDLTNTNRYYDPKTFQGKGIVYEKLMIPGRELPERKFVEKFNTLVNNFLQENANNVKLIGVHCTHGVNRTGYLISSFMISELKMSPTEAIKSVEEARGHAIERRNYRDHLLGVRTTAPAGSHHDKSHRSYNNLANNNTSHRYGNARPQTYSNNNRPLDNWRVSQSNSNNSRPTDRSLPENRYYSNENSARRKNIYYRYGKNEGEYSQHQSSYDGNEAQYSQNRSAYNMNGGQYSQYRSTNDSRNLYENDERQYYQRRDRISHERDERLSSQLQKRYSRSRERGDQETNSLNRHNNSYQTHS